MRNLGYSDARERDVFPHDGSTKYFVVSWPRSDKEIMHYSCLALKFDMFNTNGRNGLFSRIAKAMRSK